MTNEQRVKKAYPNAFLYSRRQEDGRTFYQVLTHAGWHAPIIGEAWRALWAWGDAARFVASELPHKEQP